MYKFILFTLLLQSQISLSQVKISTTAGTPVNTSILEIESPNKGFLPPRVFLSNITMNLNGAVPMDGTMVFNTNSNLVLGLGLCIWHHSQWNKLTEAATPTTTPISYVQLSVQGLGQSLPGGDNRIMWNQMLRSQSVPGDSPMWSNGSDIVIRRAGIYCVTAFVSSYRVDQADLSIGDAYVYISKNGYQIVGRGFTTGNKNVYSNVSTMMYCDVNDVIRVAYYNSTAMARVIEGGNTTCTVVQIPPLAYQ